jgi:hypothetical protein
VPGGIAPPGIFFFFFEYSGFTSGYFVWRLKMGAIGFDSGGFLTDKLLCGKKAGRHGLSPDGMMLALNAGHRVTDGPVPVIPAFEVINPGSN